MKTTTCEKYRECHYWVTTIDSFMSDWGRAKGRQNRLLLPCRTREEAERVRNYASGRNDQHSVKIVTEKSIRKMVKNTSIHQDELIQLKDWDNYPRWYR